jgi:hypothetical protein
MYVIPVDKVRETVPHMLTIAPSHDAIEAIRGMVIKPQAF